MFIDNWGNTYSNEDEAREVIDEYMEEKDYEKILSRNLTYHDLFHYVFSYHFNHFYDEFTKQIEAAENEFLERHISEVDDWETDEDDDEW